MPLEPDVSDAAVKMYRRVLHYMGEVDDPLEAAERMDLVLTLLDECKSVPELKDELHMQLMKQSKGNPNLQSKLRVWELWLLLAATSPPSNVKSLCLNYPLTKNFLGLHHYSV